MMLGGGRRVSLAELLKESGRRLSREVAIVGYELIKTTPLAAVGHIVKGLPWSDPEVVDDIVRVALEHEVDIILPLANGAVDIAARCRPLLPEVFIPVGDPDTAAVMFDKILAAKAFKEAGLPIPRTYTVLNAELPAIAKPRHGHAARGIHVFTNMEDLMHLSDIKNYLLQAYISNCREYTVDCYVSGAGDTLCVVPRERLTVSGGESTRSRTCRLPQVEEMARKVIDVFSLRGPVNIQFLHDTDRDRFLLLEVNPRLASGVICSIRAGAPIADYIIRESLGVDIRPCDDWSDGTLMTRYWKEVIFYNT